MTGASPTPGAVIFRGGSLYHVVPGYRGDVLGWVQLDFAYLRRAQLGFPVFTEGANDLLRNYEGFICIYAALRRVHLEKMLIYGGFKKAPYVEHGIFQMNLP